MQSTQDELTGGHFDGSSYKRCPPGSRGSHCVHSMVLSALCASPPLNTHHNPGKQV